MPRKTLKQRRGKTDTNYNVNRIRHVSNKVGKYDNPDNIMLELIDALEEGTKVPESGKFYIFIYNAKTPNITYDQNPLVAVTDVFQWGFRGINFHWDGSVRQYTWNEIAGGIYEVTRSELKDLQMIPFQNIRLNS